MKKNMNDTAQFYLDGSPKDFHHFVSREKPSPIDWSGLENLEAPLSALKSDECVVEVLRSLLFFYTSQKITLGKLREFFTEKSIVLFEKDGYIKIATDTKK